MQSLWTILIDCIDSFAQLILVYCIKYTISLIRVNLTTQEKNVLIPLASRVNISNLFRNLKCLNLKLAKKQFLYLYQLNYRKKTNRTYKAKPSFFFTCGISPPSDNTLTMKSGRGFALIVLFLVKL